MTTTSYGLRFGPLAPPPPLPAKAKRQPNATPKAKIDPKLVTAARELRDRYLERVNDRLLLAVKGKYDVSRALEAGRPALHRLAG